MGQSTWGLISRVSSRTYRGKCPVSVYKNGSPRPSLIAVKTRFGWTQMNPWPSATPTVDTTSDDTSKMVSSSKSKLLSTVEPEYEPTSPPDDSDDTPVWVNDYVPPTRELQSRTCG